MSDVSPDTSVTSPPAEQPRAASASGRPAPAAAMSRPLYVTGLIGALWCIGIGLAVLTTVTLVGWIAAPRTALGAGMPGVFRTAVTLWLVSHHAGVAVEHGRVGLLPLGLLVVPAALLYRSGGWMIRVGGLRRRPRVAVAHVAVALAVPYALLAGLLALAAGSPVIRPSAWQALVACFVVGVVAGGLGAARAAVAHFAAGRRVRSGLGALLRLLPERPRSLVVGAAGALAVLLAAGAVLAGVSLAVHTDEATRLYDMLSPGIVGGVLLLMIELAFLPNAVIWGMSYAVGPGFSVGAGTSVSPTGVFLDVMPAFPPLAALPEPGPAPAASLVALAAPFAAGAVGGVLTVRSMPSRSYEAAPLWGFLTGALAGLVAALLAALSGGPIGGGRMATVGPSPWQVGLLAALEIGISAAIAAWTANWLILRRPGEASSGRPGRRRKIRGTRRPGRVVRRRPEPAAAAAPPEAVETAEEPPAPAPPQEPPRPAAAPEPPQSPYTADPLEFEEAEPVLAPRRAPRNRPRTADPLPDLAPRGGDGHREGHERPAAGPYAPEPRAPEPEEDERRPSHDDAAGPEPRERTENRGGAIYVLKDEPDR
ncbi:cell division protein PerM [Actinomadura keratinilytica]|uniref:cell division protein PerM n=1 Tax=Actinomadura keratinilytica TaxID=547461 RepID=UPI003605E0CC